MICQNENRKYSLNRARERLAKKLNHTKTFQKLPFANIFANFLDEKLLPFLNCEKLV